MNTRPSPACPPHLRSLPTLFAARGEHAYPVGGCVRDTLMGTEPHDWDMAVTTVPEVTMAICHAAGYRTVPTGLKHGTVTVLVPLSGDPADREGAYDLIECTTCRTEGGYSDGRHPDSVSFTGRIEDDLSRRDFTVNAMAFMQEANSGELTVLDPFGGQDDLRAGIIRCVGDPDTRFTEDGLRLLRAVRFAVKLSFAIEEGTRAAILRRSDGLARISRERIRDELQKILCSPQPERGVSLLLELGLMPHVLPHGISPRGMGALSSLPADFTLRMACLQWGMENALVEQNLAGLRLPNTLRKDILTITRSASLPVEPTPRRARQWRHDYGDLAVPALLVRRAQEADRPADGQSADRNIGHTAAPLRHTLPSADQASSATDALVALTRRSEAIGEPVRIADLAVNGHDLIALGYKPGRLLQDILNDLLETVWEHPEKNTREELIKEALRRKE